MKPFFIYCLPRSGSCWLSVFLTAFDSYCYHEPFADMSPDQLQAKIAQRPDWVTGAVDTGAYRLQAGSIERAIAGVRSFVLKRNVVEIQASADANGVIYDAHEELGRLESLTAGLAVIDYHRIDDVGYLREIWGELIGTPFDRERAVMFTELNITRDLRKFFGSRPNLTVAGRQSVRAPQCH